MINTVNEVLSQKTIDQYKIIEEKYLILRRYLTLFFESNILMSKKDVDLIMKSLEKLYESPLINEVVKEKEIDE